MAMTMELAFPTESFELFDFVNVMTYDGPDHGTMEQFETGAGLLERARPAKGKDRHGHAILLACKGIFS